MLTSFPEIVRKQFAYFDLSNEEMRSQLNAVLDDLQPLKPSSLTAIPEKESEKNVTPLQSSILF